MSLILLIHLLLFFICLQHKALHFNSLGTINNKPILDYFCMFILTCYLLKNKSHQNLIYTFKRKNHIYCSHFNKWQVLRGIKTTSLTDQIKICFSLIQIQIYPKETKTKILVPNFHRFDPFTSQYLFIYSFRYQPVIVMWRHYLPSQFMHFVVTITFTSHIKI